MQVSSMYRHFAHMKYAFLQYVTNTIINQRSVLSPTKDGIFLLAYVANTEQRTWFWNVSEFAIYLKYPVNFASLLNNTSCKQLKLDFIWW